MQVVGLFVAQPAPLSLPDGSITTSGIAKSPAADVELGWINLDGDAQADREMHGGPDKAVLVYPVEHYDAWRADGYDLADRRVGENLSLRGATEHTVRIGETWRWGEALVQVSQPRTPCFKLAAHSQQRTVAATMLRACRTGWYLRVLQPGKVTATGEIKLVGRDDRAPTVADAVAAMLPQLFPAHPPDTLQRVLSYPALAYQWRSILIERRGRELAPAS